MSIKYFTLRMCLFIISAYLFFMTSFLFIFIDDRILGFMHTFNLYLFFALIPTTTIRFFLMKYFNTLQFSDLNSPYRKFEILLNKISKIFSVITIIVIGFTLFVELFMKSDQTLNNLGVPFFNQYGLMIGLIFSSTILYISKKLKPYVVII